MCLFNYIYRQKQQLRAQQDSSFSTNHRTYKYGGSLLSVPFAYFSISKTIRC